MIISFERVKASRDAKKAYRQELVDRILNHYGDDLKKGESEYYLEHIKSGFPIHILEGIAKRLEASGH